MYQHIRGLRHRKANSGGSRGREISRLLREAPDLSRLGAIAYGTGTEKTPFPQPVVRGFIRSVASRAMGGAMFSHFRRCLEYVALMRSKNIQKQELILHRFMTLCVFVHQPSLFITAGPLAS